MLPPSPASSDLRSDLSLHLYIAVLRRCFAQRDYAPQVHAALRAHRPDRASLRAHMRWQPGAYTRNLLHREDRFELLLLCWDFNAASPVHDHGGQRCWTQVLSGSLALETFARPIVQQPRQPQVGAGPLAPTATLPLQAGDIDFRDLAAPAHRMANTCDQRQRAVSLHIYARPMREFTVYNPRTGAAERRVP